MKNWLGHDIVPGAVVFRGGRQGDSSSFRLGVVDSVDEAKFKARVVWHWVPSHRYIWDKDQFQYPNQDANRYSVEGPAKAHTQKTSYNINDLVRLEDGAIEYANKRDHLINAAMYFKIRKEDFEKFEEDFNAGRVPDIPENF